MRWFRKFVQRENRRQHKRYAYKTAVQAKCGAWDRFANLFTADVSAGGFFIPTDEPAQIGDTISIKLALPGDEELALTGKVVSVLDKSTMEKHGKPAGIGVQLLPINNPSEKERFDRLIQLAQDSIPEISDQRTDASADTLLPPPPPKIDAPEGEALEVDESAPAESSPVESVTGATLPRTRRSQIHEGVIVGIDLGTSYSSVSSLVDGKIRVWANRQGLRSTPSVVWFPPEGDVMVGQPAKEKLSKDPGHTVASPKRMLGKSFDDRDLDGYLGRAAFESKRGPNGEVLLTMHGRDYNVPQILGYVLNDIRESTEEAMQTEIRQAVMTVPVTFEKGHLQRLRNAARLAHLEIVDVVDEPTAAASANRFDHHCRGIVGVYDFGGGTFDFSLVNVTDAGDFEVLGTSGDTWLGGDDFDAAMAEAAANQFWRQHKVDLRHNAVHWARLLEACEQAKRGLSQNDVVNIYVPKVTNTADVNIAVSQAALAKLCAPILQQSIATSEAALKGAGIKKEQLNAIYLSGGTTYMPAVRNAILNHFRVPVRSGVPPEHAVCLGAAVHAALIKRGAVTATH